MLKEAVNHFTAKNDCGGRGEVFELALEITKWGESWRPGVAVKLGDSHWLKPAQAGSSRKLQATRRQEEDDSRGSSGNAVRCIRPSRKPTGVDLGILQ